MKKHVREAIKRAGLKRSDVTVTQNNGGHFYLTIHGSKRRITTAGTPSDPSISTLKLMRDLIELKEQINANLD